MIVRTRPRIGLQSSTAMRPSASVDSISRRRFSICAGLAGRPAGAELEMPERRAGEHPGRTLGQILLPDPPEVGSQEALLQVAPAAALARTAGGGDALDERYAGGGNAPQQPIVVGRGDLRVHAHLNPGAVLDLELGAYRLQRKCRGGGARLYSHVPPGGSRAIMATTAT